MPTLDEFYCLIRNAEDEWHSSMFRDGRTGNRMRFEGCGDAIEVLREANADKPNNAYPYTILFVLRHGIELRLKEAIQDARDHGISLEFTAEEERKLREREIDPVWSTHNFARLADWLDSVIERQSAGGPDWDRTMTFLREWQEADRDGLFLRYGRSRDGAPIRLAGNFSFLPILERALDAEKTLDGVDSWIGSWERE